MKISERTISALASVVCGGSGLSSYRSGPMLVKFFNELGSNDVYGQGFPSRGYFAEGKLRELNDTDTMAQAIESAVDPRDFIGTEFSLEAVVDHINQYLRFDGFELSRAGAMYRITALGGASVELALPSSDYPALSHAFIEDQVRKCDRKIFEGDYNGAITNARTLLEAVLLAIEEEMRGARGDYDGDLIRLFRRVQQLLSLDPGRRDISDALRQVLSGLNSIVNGLAALRNSMSDAHATTAMAARRHAKLAVNASKTAADFLIETFQEQIARPAGDDVPMRAVVDDR